MFFLFFRTQSYRKQLLLAWLTFVGSHWLTLKVNKNAMKMLQQYAYNRSLVIVRNLQQLQWIPNKIGSSVTPLVYSS